MVSKKANNSGSGLAAFTVCADDELSRMAMSAPIYVPGIEFAGDFHDYISAERRPQFPSSVKFAHSCVAFVDFDRHPDHAIETVEILRNTHSPRIYSVGVSSTLETTLLLRAMRAGCSEFLEKPLAPERFQDTLQQLQQRLLLLAAPSGKRGQVVSLFGAKGGVGTTTLAVHLATFLVKHRSKKILLVDQHSQLGHVCLYLGVKESHYHFEELIRNVERLDSDLLKGFVIKHASGVDILASPDGCAAPFGCGRDDIKQVFEFLRGQYDVVVIDSSFSHDEMAAATIQYSDEVIFVVTPDVAALRDLSRRTESLRAGSSGILKLKVVINRTSPNDAISAEQVTKAVQFPVAATLPNNYSELLQALNKGEPISGLSRADFASQMSRWASKFVLDEEENEAPRPNRRTAFWR